MEQRVVGEALDRSLVANRDHIERAESEIDAFVTRRARREAQEKAEAEAWAESCRQHAVERRRELCKQWADFHVESAERLRNTLHHLIERHEQMAVFYEQKGA